MEIDDHLHYITTIIHSSWGSANSHASGFLYYVVDESTSPWKRIKETWLVTNRHVLINKKNELATSVTIHSRKIGDTYVEWSPITISKSRILYRNCKFHELGNVDVALIDISNRQSELVGHNEINSNSHLSLKGICRSYFPDDKNKISVNVGDDTLIVGYPNTFYDKLLKFPIVKSGIIASKWSSPFNGLPCFLVDAKLFPGSSGSLVISRPVDHVIEKGNIYRPSEGGKRFAFLGVYSGEYATARSGESCQHWNCLWYYYLIPEIISNGKPYQDVANSTSSDKFIHNLLSWLKHGKITRKLNRNKA